MKQIFSLTGSILCWGWRAFAAAITLISSFFFLAVLAVILVAIFSQQHLGKTEVPHGCALVLAPQGRILEKKFALDPIMELLNFISEDPRPPELLVQDIISALQSAAEDSRIKLLVIAPEMLEQAGLDQLRDIGRAVEKFKASGKSVIAFANTYSQGQYYLASWSNEIYLNPMGSVDLHGFGVFRLYMRELLDKLNISFHIFRVGSFKAAVEPFLRNNMSSEAKEDNRKWLSSLWNAFCDDIAEQRGILSNDINALVNGLADNLEAVGGDPALLAHKNKLVDGLRTQSDFRAYLKTLVGSNEDRTSFKQVKFADYLANISLDYRKPLPGKDRVAILVVQGDIVYGKGGDGQIGSWSLSQKIRKLRLDKKIKALVLRIDSPGGSAFASEMIRQELLLTQEAGKPVVVSMGSMAASGAYWIAAPADKIFAAPNTLTGSIGIFGAIPTFEKTLAKAGVFNDGIGTTAMAGTGNPTRPLAVELRRAVQSHIEHGYQQFIDIVAQGRAMQPQEVEKIAQGRVWSGATALEIGLVDEIGDLKNAVAAATQLVGLAADQAVYFEESKNPAERLLRSLQAAQTTLQSGRSKKSLLLSLADQLLKHAQMEYTFLLQTDPQDMYSHCLLPASPF